MADNAKYYSFNKGVDYDILLKHFKGQADGSVAPYLTSSRFHNKRTYANSHTRRIIIVNKPKTNTKTTNEKDISTGDVIDPTEAQRRRALNELEVAATNITTEQKTHPNHTVLSRANSKTYHKRHIVYRTPAEKRKRVKKTVDKVIQRTKDVFD